VIASLSSRLPALAGAVAAQYAAALRLAHCVEDAYGTAEETARRAVAEGAVLAGDALARWRGYPQDSSTTEVLDALSDGLAALLCCAVAEADTQTQRAWRKDRAANAVSVSGSEPRGTGPGPAGVAESEARVGMAVRRWRRCIEELAEEEARAAERASTAEAARVATLLAAVLLGGGRTRRAGDRLAELLGAQGALRLRDRGGRLLADCLERVLRGERDRCLAPLDALDLTPEHQAELIAALSVLQKER
jgi:hypothetical protein